MLQILIWAVCVLIIGVGYCGWRLTEIASKGEKYDGKSAGKLVFMLMGLLALGLFIFSIVQASKFE